MDSSPGMRLCGLTLLLQAVLGSRLLGVPVAGPGPRCAWGMRSEFGNSVKLARKLLAETKIVTRRFVSERLAGAKLPFLPSPGLLPPISLRAQTWLALPAVQRLLAMRQALGVFRAHLAVVGRREQETGGPHLAQALEDIGLDLRDLAHHIDYQLQGCGPPAPPPPAGAPGPTARQRLDQAAGVLPAPARHGGLPGPRRPGVHTAAPGSPPQRPTLTLAPTAVPHARQDPRPGPCSPPCAGGDPGVRAPGSSS
ncbi:interleukin-27 subunit alpha [Carettochelys insculpta]|uniref:interleukin-27 subunit alpha n=1 Tax=Carettochelys insculpta TaxID=44489 RepID=UPI003EB8EC57